MAFFNFAALRVSILSPCLVPESLMVKSGPLSPKGTAVAKHLLSQCQTATEPSLCRWYPTAVRSRPVIFVVSRAQLLPVQPGRLLCIARELLHLSDRLDRFIFMHQQMGNDVARLSDHFLQIRLSPKKLWWACLSRMVRFFIVFFMLCVYTLFIPSRLSLTSAGG